MALTAISACVDALVSWELASIGRTTAVRDDGLPQLGTRGLRVVAEGMPVAVSDRKNLLARELLVTGSVCAGQLAAITPAPPTQVRTKLHCARHEYQKFRIRNHALAYRSSNSLTCSVEGSGP